MKKAAIIFLIAFVATLGFLTVRYYMSPGNHGKHSDLITIHFTCDTSGRLEPCGCFSGQHGGLTRLKTWLDGQSSPGAVVKLDVGGAIAGGNDYDIIQYRYLARAYHTMGFSALNMGASEAELPAETLKSLASASPVPLISASIVNRSDRQNVLEPFRIIEVGKKRIGILGVVSPHSVTTPGEGFAVLGLNEAIDRYLPELRKTTDGLILLAFANENELRQLARDYFEFSVILGGDVQGPTQEIIRENDSLVLFTTNEARTVGTLHAKFSKGDRLRLLDPAYAIQLLWDNIPQETGLLELAQSYREEIRRTPLAIDDPNLADPNAIPGVAPTATYVGSASCKTCHTEAHKIWENSAHARAFETLVKKDADADPHCIQCHTVGFGRPTGYRRPLGGESLTDVGCESCHGPGSEHVAHYLHGKQTSFKFRPLGPGDCKSCHYGEFSRPFDWEEFWPSIRHGKEGATR